MGSEQAWDRLAAALVQLAEHGLPPDTAEELVQGNPRLGCPPGALAKVLATAREQALREAAEIARAPHTGGEQCFRAAWDQVGQSIADRILSLLTKEPKA